MVFLFCFLFLSFSRSSDRLIRFRDVLYDGGSLTARKCFNCSLSLVYVNNAIHNLLRSDDDAICHSDEVAVFMEIK